MTKFDSVSEAWSPQTRLVHLGRASIEGAVNPPVVRASTILFPDYDSFLGRKAVPTRYGLHGTHTQAQLAAVLTDLEAAEGTVLCGSGLAAVTLALTSFVQTGDDVLMVDSVYTPTRRWCENYMKRMGISVRFYPPTRTSVLEELLTDRTRVVFCESPGSLTFEIQDLPAIAALARSRNLVTICDNTWSAGLFCQPLALGIDVSLQAGTKYVAGHSDILMGFLSARGAALSTLRAAVRERGDQLASDDAYLALRGVRTLAARLQYQAQSSLAVGHYLEHHPLVKRLLHPAFPSHPQHALWARDFKGTSSLFAFTLPERGEAALRSFLESLSLFGMGYSWGGFESLITPCFRNGAFLDGTRAYADLASDEVLIRIYVGLESPEDLIADLERGLACYLP